MTQERRLKKHAIADLRAVMPEVDEYIPNIDRLTIAQIDGIRTLAGAYMNIDAAQTLLAEKAA